MTGENLGSIGTSIGTDNQQTLINHLTIALWSGCCWYQCRMKPQTSISSISYRFSLNSSICKSWYLNPYPFHCQTFLLNMLKLSIVCSFSSICWIIYYSILLCIFILVIYSLKRLHIWKYSRQSKTKNIYFKHFLLGTQLKFSSAKRRTFYEDYVCITSTEINPGCDIKEQDEV